MRSYERSIGVHGGNAIGVAIERETRVVLAVACRLAQRLHVRLDRLGIHPAEKRIAISSNFKAVDPISPEKLAKQPASRPVHRIDNETKLRGPQSIPVDQSRE